MSFFFFYYCLTICGVVEDPLQGDFPEVIEEYLEHGCMKCIAFNRRGTLLAGNLSFVFVVSYSTAVLVLFGYSP